MVKDYVVFDLETTGLSPDKDTIIEIGALKVIQGKVADRFSEFINPHQKLTQQISELTSITDDMLAGARNLQAVVGDFVMGCCFFALKPIFSGTKSFGSDVSK